MEISSFRSSLSFRSGLSGRTVRSIFPSFIFYLFLELSRNLLILLLRQLHGATGIIFPTLFLRSSGTFTPLNSSVTFLFCYSSPVFLLFFSIFLELSRSLLLLLLRQLKGSSGILFQELTETLHCSVAIKAHVRPHLRPS
jgi:hypothetical protein